MDDFKSFIDLLDKWKVAYTKEEDVIILETGTNKVDGYSCFEAMFYFKNGKFEKVGLWES